MKITENILDKLVLILGVILIILPQVVLKYSLETLEYLRRRNYKKIKKETILKDVKNNS